MHDASQPMGSVRARLPQRRREVGDRRRPRTCAGDGSSTSPEWQELSPADVVSALQREGAAGVLLVEANDNQPESGSRSGLAITLTSLWVRLREFRGASMELTPANVRSWRMTPSCTATPLSNAGTPADFTAGPGRSIYFTYRATTARQRIAFVVTPKFGAPRLFVASSSSRCAAAATAAARTTHRQPTPHAPPPHAAAHDSASPDGRRARAAARRVRPTDPAANGRVEHGRERHLGGEPAIALPHAASGTYLIALGRRRRVCGQHPRAERRAPPPLRPPPTPIAPSLASLPTHRILAPACGPPPDAVARQRDERHGRGRRPADRLRAVPRARRRPRLGAALPVS